MYIKNKTKNSPEMIKHLKACEYADAMIFHSGIEAFIPGEDYLHNEWLAAYDHYIKRFG